MKNRVLVSDFPFTIFSRSVKYKILMIFFYISYNPVTIPSEIKVTGLEERRET
jgi:hypothetical protein